MFSHHAVLLESATVTDTAAELSKSEPLLEVQTFYQKEFGIDLVRSLTATAYRSPATGYEQLCVVIGFESATVEAQNALLKLLEEPPASTQFVVCVPARSILLPTVLSRLSLGSPVDSSGIHQLPSLFTMPLKEALALIEQRHKQKDKAWFVAEQRALVAWVSGVDLLALSPSFRHAIALAVARLNTRGASNRWLLEHLVLAYVSRGRSE